VRDDVEVGAVTPVRSVCQQRAVTSDVRRRVDVALVDDERLGCGTELRGHRVELRAFVPRGVDLEQDAAVGEELAGDRLVEPGQLPRLAATHGHRVQLSRAGHVGVDEQDGAVVGERERRRLPHLEQRP
jgi:hypothetical protein